MIYTLENIVGFQPEFSIVKKRRIVGSNKKNRYELLEPLTFKLSNGTEITIPEGFIWDGSSVPRIFWVLFPPEGDFEIGALIHDYLYVNKRNKQIVPSRSFADQEMLFWSKAVAGTRKISIRNTDNQVRYIFVRLFGWIVWKDLIKIK